MIDVDALLAIQLDHDWRPAKQRARVAGGRKAGEATADSPELDAAHALAAHLPPAIEGHGGDDALFRVACELSTVLGEDAAAIAAVLVETFNPRCAPPWPEAKLLREAERAAERQSKPEARYQRRLDERAALALATPEISEPHDFDDGLVDWTAPEPPINWYCEGLAIAPSERKITLIGGAPGAGKGPLADYLAACFALGEPVFGAYPVKQCTTAILDFEGSRLTARRVHSHVRGLKRKPIDLQGTLLLRDTDPTLMLDLTWLAGWIEKHGVEVLIVDSYMSAMACSEADPNSPQYAHLARELGELGIVVIVVAHSRKPGNGIRGERPSLGDIAGSYALGGMAATAIAVWNPDEDDKSLARIGCMRAPDGAFPTIDVQWKRSGSEASPTWRPELIGESTRDTREAEEHARKVADADVVLTKACVRLMAHMRLNPGFPQTVNAVGKASGLHHSHVSVVLGALARAGFAHHTPEAKRGSSGTFVLDNDAPEHVRIHDGEAVADAPPEAGTRFGGFKRPRA